MSDELILNKHLSAFRSFSCEPPRGYVCAAKRGLIGFEEFSQCEPWYFCSPAEILPLNQRWPDFKAASQYLPFARRQDRDELACFILRDTIISGYCIVAYEIGPPLFWEIREEFSGFWDWFRSIIKDIEMWCDSTEAQ